MVLQPGSFLEALSSVSGLAEKQRSGYKRDKTMEDLQVEMPLTLAPDRQRHAGATPLQRHNPVLILGA